MTYITLFHTQKTLFIALAFAGMYGMPLPSSNSGVQAASAIPEFSTATPTHLPISGASQFCRNTKEWEHLAPLCERSGQDARTTNLQKRDAPSISRLLMLSQAVAELLRYNSNIPTKSHPSVQVADSSENLDLNRGRPSDPDRGAGSRATNSDDPPDRGRPGGPRPGAGSRGGQSCPRADKPLTLLMPVNPKTLAQAQDRASGQTASGSELGLTVAERPIFWFYIPYSLTSERPIEFVLQDDQGNDIYQTILTESGTSPGILGFKLPSTAPSLEVNKTYRWYFYIYCTADRTDEPTFVDGWVKRVAINPSLKRQLQQAKPQQRFELYAKAGIWHEAVTSLAELRRQHPEDTSLENEWTTLLQAMNLEAIAKEPITSVLTPEQ